MTLTDKMGAIVEKSRMCLDLDKSKSTNAIFKNQDQEKTNLGLWKVGFDFKQKDPLYLENFNHDYQKVLLKSKNPHQFQSFGKAPTFKNQQNPTYSHHTPLNSLISEI